MAGIRIGGGIFFGALAILMSLGVVYFHNHTPNGLPLKADSLNADTIYKVLASVPDQENTLAVLREWSVQVKRGCPVRDEQGVRMYQIKGTIPEGRYLSWVPSTTHDPNDGLFTQIDRLGEFFPEAEAAVTPAEG